MNKKLALSIFAIALLIFVAAVTTVYVGNFKIVSSIQFTNSANVINGQFPHQTSHGVPDNVAYLFGGQYQAVALTLTNSTDSRFTLLYGTSDNTYFGYTIREWGLGWTNLGPTGLSWNNGYGDGVNVFSHDSDSSLIVGDMTQKTIVKGTKVSTVYSDLVVSNVAAYVSTTNSIIFTGLGWINPRSAITVTASTLSRSGTNATFNSTVAHNLLTGMSVTIAGATPSGFNGAYVVTVTSTTQFTYTLSSDPGANATGTITATKAAANTTWLDLTALNGTWYWTGTAYTNGSYGVVYSGSAGGWVMTNATYTSLANQGILITNPDLDPLDILGTSGNWYDFVNTPNGAIVVNADYTLLNLITRSAGAYATATPTVTLSSSVTLPYPILTNFTAYAAGTAYTLTATPALAHFGTTDPSVTINQAGTYFITCGLGVKYSGATYAGAQTITVKLRRTNNTAADLTGASRAVELPVLTTFTGGDSMTTPGVFYTAASGDIIQLFASVSATPAAGSVLIDSAEIVAIRRN